MAAFITKYDFPSSSSFSNYRPHQFGRKNKIKTSIFSIKLQSTSEGREGEEQQQRRPFLLERYQDGTSKRYTLDDKSKLQAIWEEHDSLSGNFGKEGLSWLPDAIRGFVLPIGFPGSVSDDYLIYMLLQFPTNVTGWICYTLVTSSLLKAAGVGSFTGTSAAASAAAIRWISKDGLGAIGRLFIGGRFGSLFDNDPKQWRMYADFIGSAGSIFELATPLYPGYFLLLASLGNLTKAVASGLKDPSFRVIQNHFAISGNLGEIASKEEVWEVTAKLMGLAIGILIMDTPGMQSSYDLLVYTWLGVRIIHLWLRYQSLSVLRFRTINQKRARVLVKSHVSHNMVPGYVECNKKENILTWERFMHPRVTFAVSIDKMIPSECSIHMVKALLEVYAKEKYILFPNKKGSETAEYFVTFKVGATSMSVLKSLWHVHWLHVHPNNNEDQILNWLEESLPKLEEGFSEFIEQLEIAGWERNQIALKVPQNIIFDQDDFSTST